MGLFKKKDEYKVENSICTVYFNKAGKLTEERVELLQEKLNREDCQEVHVMLGKGVTAICPWAFKKFSKLTSIVIHNKVTFVGEYAFWHCYNTTIYCEAPKKPSGWDPDWNKSNLTVIWNHVTTKGKQINA